MKKITIGLFVAAMIAVLAIGIAYAVSENSKACEKSNGPESASESGNNHASGNSVLNRCGPQCGPDEFYDPELGCVPCAILPEGC